MNKLYLPLILLLGMLHSAVAQPGLDKEGHRGCRGLMPENTIPAMKKGLDLGVNTLEMDVVISKDKRVVISHEPFMSSEIALTPNGKPFSASQEKSYNLYQLSYAEIATFDVGSKFISRFPTQKKMMVHKPLLSDLIDSVEAYVVAKNLPAPHYNIEIKSAPEGDLIFHPAPEEFVALVMAVLVDKKITDRVIIQSFDPRSLQIMHKNYPAITLSLLVENIRSVQSNFETLGFMPNIYSPYYKLMHKRTVKYCHKNGIKIVPWTINTKREIDKYVYWGVDGIISDYPDLFSDR